MWPGLRPATASKMYLVNLSVGLAGLQPQLNFAYVVGEGVVPVELVGDDVFPGVRRLLPRESDRGGAGLQHAQVRRLAGHTLLGLHLTNENKESEQTHW